MKILRQYLFLAGIVCVLIFSLFVPKPGQFISDNELLTPLTFLAMFISGLGLSFKNITGGLKNYKAIFYSMAAVYGLFPLVVFVLFNVIDYKGDIFVGATIMAAQSSTLATAVVLTVSAGGNASLALIITIVNNVISAFLTPLVLNVTMSLDQHIEFDVSAMIIKLLWVLVLPVVLAQLLRLVAGGFVSRLGKTSKLISQLVVLFFVMAGASSASSGMASNLSVVPLTLGIAVVIHLIMISASIIYSRLVKIDRESRTAIMFCSSQKTLPASLFVWKTFFPAFPLAPIFLITYHVMQIFIDSIIVNILNNRQKKTEKAGMSEMSKKN